MEIVASAWARGITVFVFAVVCIFLIIVILLQKGRGGGLAGAFGGAGGHSAFGAKTGDVFTWVTVALTGLFILAAVIGNYTFVPDKPADQQSALTPGSPSEESEAPGGGDVPARDGQPAPSSSTTRPSN